MSPTRQSLIGHVIADRYQVLSLLGQGGMGRVYLAEHVRMGRKSAVKVMSPQLAGSADAVARFHREAANACRINHPNVAIIYDFGETDDGLLYLAMEYIEGQPLTAILAREGNRGLPLTRAAELTRQIAEGLGAAHHLGIVHRDLKPDNIMVARAEDGGDIVKLVDFGIAKANGVDSGSQTLTMAGISMGTPEYMSPEQLSGERSDARTDVYALGLVLFNMLTGDLPHPRLTSRETLVRRLTAPPKTLVEARPDIGWPFALQLVLDQALAPDVDRRYASVRDLGRDVVDAVTAHDGMPTVLLMPDVTASVPNAERAAPPEGPGRTVPLLVEAATPVPPPRRRPSWRIAALVSVLVLGLLATLGMLLARPASDKGREAPRQVGAAVPHPTHIAPTARQAPAPTSLSAAASPRDSLATESSGSRPDTASVTTAPPPTAGTSVAATTDIIREHLERAAAALVRDDYAAARREAQAAEVRSRELREQHPNRETLLAVNRSLSGARRDLFEACVGAKARAVNEEVRAELRCDALLRGSAGAARRFSAR